MAAWPLIRILPREFHLDFVKPAPIAAVFSALLIIGSGISLAINGMNLGIDFSGGVQMEIATSQQLDQATLRSTLADLGVHEAQINIYTDNPREANIRFRPDEANEANAVAQVSAGLERAFPNLQVSNPTTVGGKVSGETMLKGFMALGIAVLLMLAYIWFRFQLQFGLGAVVGVTHDVIITLGVLSALGIEFSMTSIAALLTVIGYSMNEKVITFDRLRENLRKYKVMPLRDVINKSENERLSRTLITGTTAILALAGALFFGGPVLFPLVFTMVFGVVIGTYSSIYVALPIILLWGVRRNDEDPTPVKFGPASKA